MIVKGRMRERRTSEMERFRMKMFLAVLKLFFLRTEPMMRLLPLTEN